MAIDKRVQQMIDGDKNAIIGGLISKSCILCVNAIIQATLHGMKDEAIGVQLRRLKKDDTCIFGDNVGYKVSDFACAALHLLDIVPYNGNNNVILALIESKLEI